MRIRLFTIGLLLCMPAWLAEATTLKEAMDRAGTLHPELKISELNIEAARGQLMEQSAYAYNPELSLEPQRRRLNGGEAVNDYYIGLSQGIELMNIRKNRAATFSQNLKSSAEFQQSNRSNK